MCVASKLVIYTVKVTWCAGVFFSRGEGLQRILDLMLHLRYSLCVFGGREQEEGGQEGKGGWMGGGQHVKFISLFAVKGV